MSLLRGRINVCRFDVVSQPEVPDFSSVPFREISDGSEIRESIGFVEMDSGPYRVANSRFAFRVRIDRKKADTALVKERIRDLVRAERRETGRSIRGTRLKELKALAEEELIVQASPKTKIIEACIDDTTLYIADTGKAYIGAVLLLLRQIGVVAELKTPWRDLNLPEAESEILNITDPNHSAHGCRFLRWVASNAGQSAIMIDPTLGQAQLQIDHDTKATISGDIIKELHRYIDEGAEVLSAKVLTETGPFRLDGRSFQINGLKMDSDRYVNWTDLLDERLESLSAVYDLLYEEFRKWDTQGRK